MVQKRPASNPPPGPGQPSSRLRTPSTAAPDEALRAPVTSPAASGGVGSSERVVAPGRVTGSGGPVGSSARKSPATSVGGPGLGGNGGRGGEPVSSGGGATGGLAAGGKQVRAGAGPSQAVQPVISGPVGSLDENKTSVDSDEDEDEDGVNWEDVDLGPQAMTDFLSSAPNENSAPAPLSLTLGGKGKKPERTVRKITPVERRIRWETHRMHLLCLLHHISLRNRWCNSPEVQGSLSPLVKWKIRRLLIDDPNDQVFRRSQLFLEGLKILSDIWVENFRVMRAGLSKCRWDGPEVGFIPHYPLLPVSRALICYREFVIVSEMRKGSRDIGAQLFCAMLRSVGVTCRLVCSLQALPFTFASNEPPMKAPVDATAGPDKGIGYISKTWIRNCRQNDYGTRRDERCWPVYWVEAWCVAKQKWIAVDPFATKTVGKPSAIEPPVQVPGNLMSYVVGFEDDGDCTDVTRRYAQAFITKTRKVRVTGTPSGEVWWDRVMAILATGTHPDRQQIEQAELTNKILHEPIPKSLKYIKGHPLYVIERHLKRDESFKILRKCGTLTTGFGKNKKTEPVYRREDVIKLRSLENWIRLGRAVKPEEKNKPIKYVKAVRLPSTKLRNARSGNVEPEMSGLYAESQTELCVPEPLVNGRLVKNKFGNIDLFVESMLPKGAVHLPHGMLMDGPGWVEKNVDKAARLVGVDFAPAITGFEYRHGHAYPVATGIVVAKEYREAIAAVHEGLVEAQDEKAARNRDMKALCMWRRFLTKLRILDHVSRIPEEQEVTHHPMTMMANNWSKAVEKGVVEVVEADEEEFGGFRGGFFSVSEESEPRLTRKLTKEPQALEQRRGSPRASHYLASATKTTPKKTARSKSTTATKAKRNARKPRGRKVITESEEEEAEESEDSDSSTFSRAQHGSRRSSKFNYKYNFYAGSDSDASGSGEFLKQQGSGIPPRRSTRLATTAKTAARVKYTLDEDDDEADLELELELELELRQGEEKEMQNQKERASGGFLIRSDNSSSELSDAPSDLTDAEYEAPIGNKPIESDSALERGKQGDEGGDGDDEDEGDDNSEPRGAAGAFEMPYESRKGGDLDRADYVAHAAGPITEDGTVDVAKTGQRMADASSNDHHDNDIAAGKLHPVGNRAEGSEVVAGTAASLDTMGMAGPGGMYRKEQTPDDDSSPMLSEDPEDKENSDLDWCNFE
ncbi:unnamed protein product [Tuber aestivum]|uniref:Rad4 beta-hairpin domain-containing protein n=1 Tax=Tuber aestivum TaxID=59557 RepID=A0A292Q2S2_9PEZI|nr:unnamed protein product [Tuber aestivum]